MTWRQAIHWGKEALRHAEIPDFSWDAERLFEFVLQCDRTNVLVGGSRLLTEKEEKSYRALIARRAAHVPLQYIIGSQEFMGLSFRVNEAVLIPRQDTECLVELVLAQLPEIRKAASADRIRVLDMCTGSGCIGVSLAKLGDAEVTAVDISGKALAVARENSRLHDCQMDFIESDLFERVTGSYHVIVSNPPYIKRDDIAGLMEEVRGFEPKLALDGGVDGLSFYRRMIGQAGKFLTHGGRLYFEIGWEQKEAVSEEMEKAGFLDVTAEKDLAGLNRVVYGRKA